MHKYKGAQDGTLISRDGCVLHRVPAFRAFAQHGGDFNARTQCTSSVLEISSDEGAEIRRVFVHDRDRRETISRKLIEQIQETNFEGDRRRETERVRGNEREREQEEVCGRV